MTPDGSRDPEPVSDESIVDRFAKAQCEKHKWIEVCEHCGAKRPRATTISGSHVPAVLCLTSRDGIPVLSDCI